MSTQTPAKTSTASRPPSKVQRYVDLQLNRTRRQVKSTELIVSVLTAVLLAIGFVLAVAVIDAWVWPLNGAARWAALTFLVGGLAVWAIGFLVPVLRRRIHPDYAAKMIEDAQPTFRNSLLNYVSLRRKPQHTHAAVLDAISHRAARDLQKVPEDATVDQSGIIRVGSMLLAMIAVATTYWLVSPKDPLPTLARILLPSVKQSAPSFVRIENVQPGDATAFFGDEVQVTATVTGAFEPQDVRLVVSTLDGQVVDRTVAMEPDDSERGLFRGRLSVDGGGLMQSVVYRVVARDGASPDYEMMVRPNPSVAIESIRITPPQYTRLQEEVIENRGDIEAVEGSRIDVRAVANLPVRIAYIELLNRRDEGDAGAPFRVVETVSMQVEQSAEESDSGRASGPVLTGNFLALLDDQRRRPRVSHYRVRFVSTTDDRNDRANVYTIRTVPDLAPEIEVLNPVENPLQLPVNETLLIDTRAFDSDYGIAAIELEMSSKGVSVFPRRKLPLQSESGRLRVRGQFLFKPADHFLQAGETAMFTVIASDNRTSHLSGLPDPNTAISPQYRIEIVDAVANPKRPPGDPSAKGTDPGAEPKTGDQRQEDRQSNEGTASDGADGGVDDGSGPSDPSPSEDGSEDGASSESDEGSASGSESADSSSSAKQQQQASDQQDGSNSESGPDGESNPASESGSEGDGEGDGDGRQPSASQSAPRGQEGASSDPTVDGNSEDASPEGSASPAPENGEQHLGSSESSSSASPESGGARTAERKPLDENASDGEVMSRLEEMMKEREDQAAREKGGDGSQGENASPGGDDAAAKENSSPGVDPQQDDPRRSQGTGSNREGDAEKPQDADPGENNVQRGDGNSSSSKGKQNGSAKGASGSETNAQSQEGASSDDSNEGQSDETGGSDPGEARSGDDASGQADRPAGESASGKSSDSQAPASDRPGEGSNQESSKGSGDDSTGQSKPPGDESAADGGKPGDEKSPGGEGSPGGEADGQPSREGGGQGAGGEPAKSKPSNKPPGDPEGGGTDQSSEEQSDESPQGGGASEGGTPPPAGGGDPSDGSGGGSGKGSGGTPVDGEGSGKGEGGDPNGQPKKTGDGGPGGAGRDLDLIREQENVEHAKKATDMILKRLAEEQSNPDQEMLDELGWSQKDLDQFLSRWQAMKAKADSGDVVSKRRYDQALRSLGLSPDRDARAVEGISDQQRGFDTDSAVNRPPPKIAPGYRAFLRDRNRATNDR